jgi:hypothetical protein
VEPRRRPAVLRNAAKSPNVVDVIVDAFVVVNGDVNGDDGPKWSGHRNRE